MGYVVEMMLFLDKFGIKNRDIGENVTPSKYGQDMGHTYYNGIVIAFSQHLYFYIHKGEFRKKRCLRQRGYINVKPENDLVPKVSELHV